MNHSENKEFLWVESYRPQTIEDCILPEQTKNTFKEFIKAGQIPNLLLSGPPGIGKTTVAKALCNELGTDFYLINGSDEGRFLDTVRNKAKNFASTVSLTSDSKHKVIIIDEADNTGPDVQLLLRANIEQFHQNCRFIFTCNYKNKIIEPLHSRCAVVDFSIGGKEKSKLAFYFLEKLESILTDNLVIYEKKLLVLLIKKYFPDFRRVLNECQRYSVGGVLNKSILSSSGNCEVNELMKYIKEKKFSEVQKWIISNIDNNPSYIFRSIYDAIFNHLSPHTLPAVILILSEYQYKSTFAVDQEINMFACMIEIMSEAEFK